MKKRLAIFLAVAAASCGAQKTATHDQVLHEGAFHAKQDKIIKAHLKMLVDAGRITDAEHVMDFALLGTYGWYNGVCDEGGNASPCYFGSYVFSPEAFEQAKNIFIIHGQMEGGSDFLIDVGSGAFDKSIVGHIAGSMTYCELTGGKLRHCNEGGFTGGKVIEFIDKNTVRLDKKAKWNADMYGLEIRPDDFMDMCRCTAGESVPPHPL
jgi:hypothetical protein